MALYEIKNYIKLLCIRIDHIESYVVDELNTSDEQKINEFVKMYKHRKGLKILIFEMADEAHMITYEQMQSFIHTLKLAISLEFIVVILGIKISCQMVLKNTIVGLLTIQNLN